MWSFLRLKSDSLWFQSDGTENIGAFAGCSPVRCGWGQLPFPCCQSCPRVENDWIKFPAVGCQSHSEVCVCVWGTNHFIIDPCVDRSDVSGRLRRPASCLAWSVAIKIFYIYIFCPVRGNIRTGSSTGTHVWSSHLYKIKCIYNLYICYHSDHHWYTSSKASRRKETKIYANAPISELDLCI